jgi:hypothetical protein
LRLKAQGKSEAELVNNFIPYVICKDPEDKPNPSLADKAYHPDEYLQQKNKLTLDYDWYITT